MGYIGSHAIVELYSAWYQTVIIDNLSNTTLGVLWSIKKLVWVDIPYYDWDIRDQDILSTIFTNHKIDAVMHFAAKKAVWESMEMPFEYYDNNINGSIALTRAMDHHGVKYLIFSGTCAVYSPTETAPYNEKSAIWPESVYAITKRICEELFEWLYKSGKLSTLVLRYFNPIGNHESASIGEVPIGVPQNLMPYLMQVINGKREELFVYGNNYDTSDGTCIRDYIHVVDLAQAHVKALEYLLSQKWQFYDIINVGTGKGTSVLEMIHHVESVIGYKFPYRIVDRRSGDLAIVYGNVDKARQVLGWEAKYSLWDGIRDMIRFYNKK